MSRQCIYRCQRGAVLPLLAVGMLAIIGVVGISIDVGHVFLNKTRLQNSLDSAALSGARTLMLTEDTAAASTDARAAFDDHLNGEMATLDAGTLVLEYSNTLVPFVAGGSDPHFVRAIYRSFTTKMSFSSVLPNVDESMSIAASAVAGPIPVGGSSGAETCDIAPISICPIPGAEAGDSDCSDGYCFGFEIGTRKEYKISLGPEIDSEPAEEQATASAEQSPITCDVGGIDCVTPPVGNIDFLLNRVDCTDDICIRTSTAGSYSSCLTQNANVNIEQGATQIPILQGLMTRFGIYHATLSAVDFPPDVVTTQGINYLNYQRDFASAILSGSSNNGSATNRRVLTVPVVNCEEGAADVRPLRRILCLFLTRIDEDSLHGELVNDCETSGEQGQTVPRISDNYSRPMEITLYKDPDASES